MAKNKPICKVDKWGNKFWWANNKLHREDGPAYEGVDGRKEWYLDDIYYSSFQEYLKELKKLNKSNEEIMLIALKYG
jgi:hypothetical protein